VLPIAGEGVRVTSLTPGVLELLPDPGRVGYRIRAVVRHDNTYYLQGEVGLYVAGTRRLTQEGPQHFMARAAFVDVGPRATLARDRIGRPGSQLRLEAYFCGSSPTLPARSSWSSVGSIFFVPEDPWKTPGPWRPLTVEVRPGEVRAGWQGQTLSLDPAEVLREWVPRLHKHHADLRGVDVDLPVRGSLGLYVYGGTMTVRSFTVEPLDDANQ
jgi:hypothetical protein